MSGRPARVPSGPAPVPQPRHAQWLAPKLAHRPVSAGGRNFWFYVPTPGKADR